MHSETVPVGRSYIDGHGRYAVYAHSFIDLMGLIVKFDIRIEIHSGIT